MTLSAFCLTAPPPNVEKVVVTHNESSIALQWNKVDRMSTYRLEIEDGKHFNVTDNSGETVEYVISGLDPGRKYSFTLFTVTDKLRSSGRQFTAVTGR